MKLLKYFFFLMILISSIYFLIELNQLNTENGEAIKIKIPFMSQEISTTDLSEDKEGISELVDQGFNVWLVLLITFTIGVVIGFVISLIQMISLKGETISLKSKNKKIQIELDALRNQGLEDELELEELENNNISL